MRGSINKDLKVVLIILLLILVYSQMEKENKKEAWVSKKTRRGGSLK